MTNWLRQVLACVTLSAATCVAGCDPYDPGACDAAAVVTTPVAPVQCPGLYTVVVTPSQIDVGAAATVTATAPAGMDSGAAVLTWSAPTGMFWDLHAAQTTFVCTAAGEVSLTLSVSQTGCTETTQVQVGCLGSGDGGGVGDSG